MHVLESIFVHNILKKSYAQFTNSYYNELNTHTGGKDEPDIYLP